MRYSVKKISSKFYLMYRNKKGYTTPRTDKKYIIEVRSKKTKKVVGYLNNKSLKPITPPKSIRLHVQKSIEAKRDKNEFFLKLTSSRPIYEQVLEACPNFVRRINRTVSTIGSLQLDVRVTAEMITYGTESLYIDRRISPKYFAYQVGMKLAWKALSDNEIRMSPKKIAKYKNFKHIRSAILQVFIVRY